jgi:ectoine hydroxylase-related dioxygenase (phytanoyl-CoA dioxygenase family)
VLERALQVDYHWNSDPYTLVAFMPTALQFSSALDLTVDSASADWLERTLALLETAGFAIVTDIVSETERHAAREGFLRVKSAQQSRLSGDPSRLARANDDREVRLLMKDDPFFYRFLEHPAQLAVIDRFLSPSATLRFQQATAHASTGRVGPWHMNFRRVLNGYRAALEVVFSIDSLEPGSYYFALGSHHRLSAPDVTVLEQMSRTFAIPEGAMVLFDGTLWHQEGDALFDSDRLLVLQQFVPHFVKPHIDYVRALGEDVLATLPLRTRRLLGWESRVPASLEEFYADPAERMYLPEQG